MIFAASVEEPPEPTARPVSAGWAFEPCTELSPGDPSVRETLKQWIAAADRLSARPLAPRTRLKLDDFRRIAEELARVLADEEPGEGTPELRRLLGVAARGRLQALVSAFVCPRGTFVELLVAAPWNLLGPDDPCDLRTVRGAGAALLALLEERSRRRGCRGRLALMAENPRSRERYERLGFRRMCAADAPLELVPAGHDGWSRSILRVACGAPGPEEERCPWMVLEPDGSPAQASAGRAAQSPRERELRDRDPLLLRERLDARDESEVAPEVLPLCSRGRAPRPRAPASRARVTPWILRGR